MESNKQDYPLSHGTYQFMDEGMKILVDGLFEFVLAIFPGFGLLSLADKWLLIRNYAKLFHCTDGEMRARQRFEKGSTTVFVSYATVVSTESVGYFFGDCLNERIAAEAANTLHGWLDEHIPNLNKEIEQVDPSEDEYFAMIGLALWSVENLDASDQLLTLASRYRTEIMAELTDMYRRTIGVEQGAIRVGKLLCLLQEFRRIVMTLQSNHAIYRMIGAVDENSLTIQLPVK
ncbi:hypothetical protein PENTCL1PPCAC_15743 [Pristionchus entomophagus]|uniref:NR LBD domain-containing protein n=1 Tax=Pristionchus entomophagus TaxID=358040 RepID=A0AAV5TGT5_9BILA|nr:hypothetical protein PENTCL1PPCAC_15743 [Pristionchus entomophagus]